MNACFDQQRIELFCLLKGVQCDHASQSFRLESNRCDGEIAVRSEHKQLEFHLAIELERGRSIVRERFVVVVASFESERASVLANFVWQIVLESVRHRCSDDIVGLRARADRYSQSFLDSVCIRRLLHRLLVQHWQINLSKFVGKKIIWSVFFFSFRQFSLHRLISLLFPLFSFVLSANRYKIKQLIRNRNPRQCHKKRCLIALRHDLNWIHSRWPVCRLFLFNIVRMPSQVLFCRPEVPVDELL